MFDISWGEVLVIVSAGSYLVGRKELPRIAHIGGRYVGRTVGSIIKAKNEFFEATKDNELAELQRDFQKGLNELNTIKNELASAGSFQRPTRPAPRAPSFQPRHSPPTSETIAYHNYQGSPTNSSDSEQVRKRYASLALAELQLQNKEDGYSSNIERGKGGADYISSCFVDSVVLDEDSSKKSY